MMTTSRGCWTVRGFLVAAGVMVALASVPDVGSVAGVPGLGWAHGSNSAVVDGTLTASFHEGDGGDTPVGR